MWLVVMCVLTSHHITLHGIMSHHVTSHQYTVYTIYYHFNHRCRLFFFFSLSVNPFIDSIIRMYIRTFDNFNFKIQLTIYKQFPLPFILLPSLSFPTYFPSFLLCFHFISSIFLTPSLPTHSKILALLLISSNNTNKT